MYIIVDLRSGRQLSRGKWEHGLSLDEVELEVSPRSENRKRS